MIYTGEHLFPGGLGHFFAVLSLVVSLVATIGFYKSNKAVSAEEKQSWYRLARTAFLVETFCVIGIISCIYSILASGIVCWAGWCCGALRPGVRRYSPLFPLRSFA